MHAQFDHLKSVARGDPATLLSTHQAGARDRRLALAAALVSCVVFAGAAPFAKQPLGQLWAFIPIYQSALVVNDLITAVLLFGQFAILGSLGSLVLACGYLFTAAMAAVHALTFPGLFAPTGLLGASPQTTAWLYMFWHAGLPLCVIGYTLLDDRRGFRLPPSAVFAIGVAATGMAVIVLAALATAGVGELPAIMQGNRYTPAMITVVSAVWLSSLLALGMLLWRRRPYSVLDLWLMVVMCAWMFDVALSAVLNAGRFDLGFYAGRIYGLLAATFVLVVLLLENGKLYARLLESSASERREASDEIYRQAERLRIVHEIDRAIIAEAKPEAIAAGVLQPLRELLAARRVSINMIDHAAGKPQWLAAAGPRHNRVGRGETFPLHVLGDIAALKRGEPQAIDTKKLPPSAARDTLLASGVHHYVAVPMIAGGELIGTLGFGGEQMSIPAERVAIAQEVATQLAVAIGQARLFEQVRRQAERLRIVHEIDRALISEAEPHRIAAAALPPLRDLLGVPRVNVNLIDAAAGDGEWLAAAGRQRTHAAPGIRFPLHMLGDLGALGRGEPQTIDTASLPATPQREALLASGVRHYIAVPMIAGGELIGALSFGGEDRSFPPEQVAIAQETATQLGIAIAQARLYERSTRSAERLRIVHDIDRAIIANEAPQAIAGAVISSLRELLGVPRAIVNLIDLETSQVEWLAAAGRKRVHVGPGVRYGLHLMGDVAALKRGENQLIDTRSLPPGPEVEALLASGVKVYLAVPMIASGELIGAISFGGEQAAFPPEQIAIAREVATQLAIAISQARLFERVQKHAAELELRVEERTTELQAVNQELESFSYSVSHDLRAPLRAVDGYALMLEEDYAAKLDDEGRRLLGVVRGEAARMGQLIDDLLHFSQVGRRQLAKAQVDMHALVSEVVAESSALYPKARIHLDRLPAASGDRSLLRHVWVNLVSNALKYSSQCEAPRVTISAEQEGANIVYAVRDNGAGFEMRYYDKLFKVFQRLHRQDEFEGTGVGLAIVQRVVTRHGGRVWAESEYGKGACFRFSLPGEG